MASGMGRSAISRCKRWSKWVTCGRPTLSGAMALPTGKRRRPCFLPRCRNPSRLHLLRRRRLLRNRNPSNQFSPNRSLSRSNKSSPNPVRKRRASLSRNQARCVRHRQAVVLRLRRSLHRRGRQFSTRSRVSPRRQVPFTRPRVNRRHKSPRPRLPPGHSPGPPLRRPPRRKRLPGWECSGPAKRKPGRTSTRRMTRCAIAAWRRRMRRRAEPRVMASCRIQPKGRRPAQDSRLMPKA